MLKSILTLALLAFSHLVSSASLPDADKHHGGGCGTPACCGCDTSHDKARVKILTKTFLDLLYGGENISRALELATENNKVLLQVEGCSDNTCCLVDTNLSGYLPEVGAPVLNYWIDEVKELHGNEFMVYSTVVLSYPNEEPPRGLNMRLALKWVPTIGCNHKVAEMHGMSFACQKPITNLCSNCQA